MRTGASRSLKWALLCAVAATLVVGCGKKDDPIAQAEKKDVARGVSAPGIAETKAIAEEAFIYGLPIVMNYAVMNEFVIDRNSGQYKAPFNTISNGARVVTCKDTAVVDPAGRRGNVEAPGSRGIEVATHAGAPRACPRRAHAGHAVHSAGGSAGPDPSTLWPCPRSSLRSTRCVACRSLRSCS